MDEKQLMKDFCLVSGLDEQQAEGWKPLVLGCWEELCRRLRPAVVALQYILDKRIKRYEE